VQLIDDFDYLDEVAESAVPPLVVKASRLLLDGEKKKV
jgi:hypothetical protein